MRLIDADALLRRKDGFGGMTMKQMTPKEYRKKHKRCRTCVYAYERWGAKCRVKNIALGGYQTLEYCGLRGMFCRAYQPKEVDNG